MMRTAAALLSLLLSLLFALPLLAQNQPGQDTALLRLEKARLEFQASRLEFERAQRAREEGLISASELERRELDMRRAELALAEAWMEAAGGLGRLVVREAVKERGGDGRSRVRVRIAYQGGRLELPLLSSEVADRLRAATARAEGATISLLADGVVISEPYEREIAPLAAGEELVVLLGLLQDVDRVEVVLRWGGREESRTFQLEKDSAGQAVVLSSEQASQEGDLGTAVSFDLHLERFARDTSLLDLAVVGLPPEIHHEFVDPESQARLTRIRFPQGVTSRDLSLRLYLPREPTAGVVIDQPLTLEAVCYFSAGGQTRAVAGQVSLELVPRGSARLALEISNLYREARRDDAVIQVGGSLHNLGSRAASNLRWAVQLPLAWRAEIDPEVVAELPPLEAREVTVRLYPAAGSPVGDYEVRLRAEATAFGRRVESEETVLRVHLAPPARGWGLTVVILLILAVFGGLAAGAFYLVRR